jgi:hypothetical protein
MLLTIVPALTAITIPNSIISIGNHTFDGCRGLASVTIPNSVISIGTFAFYKCIGLAAITIPNSIVIIGGGAFADCRNLDAVHVNWSDPEEVMLGGSLFYNIKSGAKLYVPTVSLEAYRQTSSQWRTYFNTLNIVGE